MFRRDVEVEGLRTDSASQSHRFVGLVVLYLQVKQDWTCNDYLEGKKSGFAVKPAAASRDDL